MRRINKTPTRQPARRLPKDWIGFLPAFAMTRLKMIAMRQRPQGAGYSRRLWARPCAWMGLCWLMLAGSVFAQQEESGRAISTVSNLDYIYSNLPTQPVGPDDLLALSVYDSPELTRTVRVDANGNICLPMLKDLIPVRGLVPSQVETTIVKSLI